MRLHILNDYLNFPGRFFSYTLTGQHSGEVLMNIFPSIDHALTKDHLYGFACMGIYVLSRQDFGITPYITMHTVLIYSKTRSLGHYALFVAVYFVSFNAEGTRTVI